MMTDTQEIVVADKTTETDVADKGSDKGAEKTADKGAEKSTDKAPLATGADNDKGDDKGSEKGKTLATGADTEIDDTKKATEKKAPTQAETWQQMREAIATHYAAGDEKIYKKEMKRLERISGPEGLYGMYRELEGRFSEGGLLKLPGKTAKPEEIAAFHKALGVPEKAEDYFKDVKLANGAVIGEADKPLLDTFAGELHKVGATPAVMNAAINWYYAQQEAQAAGLDAADDGYRRESEAALKEELGPTYKRLVNSIGSLFAGAPGGTDVKNENSLFARLMGGRMADGKVIGNDPDVVRFLVSMVKEIRPLETVTEDGQQGGLSVNEEIKKIEKIMREDRRDYDKNYAPRYSELLAAREKNRARQRA